MIDRSRQIKLLRQCAMLFAHSRTSNESSYSRWLKIVLFSHTHGYLYCGFDNEGVDLAAIAYRVPSINIHHGDTLPTKETGNILYVCSVASKTSDRHKLLRILRWYQRENTDVTHMMFHYRNTNQLKVKNLLQSSEEKVYG